MWIDWIEKSKWQDEQLDIFENQWLNKFTWKLGRMEAFENGARTWNHSIVWIIVFCSAAIWIPRAKARGMCIEIPRNIYANTVIIILFVCRKHACPLSILYFHSIQQSIMLFRWDRSTWNWLQWLIYSINALIDTNQNTLWLSCYGCLPLYTIRNMNLIHNDISCQLKHITLQYQNVGSHMFSMWFSFSWSINE